MINCESTLAAMSQNGYPGCPPFARYQNLRSPYGWPVDARRHFPAHGSTSRAQPWHVMPVTSLAPFRSARSPVCDPMSPTRAYPANGSRAEGKTSAGSPASSKTCLYKLVTESWQRRRHTQGNLHVPTSLSAINSAKTQQGPSTALPSGDGRGRRSSASTSPRDRQARWPRSRRGSVPARPGYRPPRGCRR